MSHVANKQNNTALFDTYGQSISIRPTPVANTPDRTVGRPSGGQSTSPTGVAGISTPINPRLRVQGNGRSTNGYARHRSAHRASSIECIKYIYIRHPFANSAQPRVALRGALVDGGGG